MKFGPVDEYTVDGAKPAAPAPAPSPTGPRTIENPGMRVYVRIAKVEVEDEGRVAYVPESCRHAPKPAGLRLRDGQEIRVRWPDRGVTRQLVASVEYKQRVEVNGSEREVVSYGYGFYRQVPAVTIRGWTPERPLVWVDLDGLEMEMPRVELLSMEAAMGVDPSRSAERGLPVPAPTPAAPAEDAMSRILGALEGLSGRLEALEKRDADKG